MGDLQSVVGAVPLYRQKWRALLTEQRCDALRNLRGIGTVAFFLNCVGAALIPVTDKLIALQRRERGNRSAPNFLGAPKAAHDFQKFFAG
jgi:hypothetical protein